MIWKKWSIEILILAIDADDQSNVVITENEECVLQNEVNQSVVLNEIVVTFLSSIFEWS